MPFDEANRFARALGVELSGNDAKRILSGKSGKATLKAAVESWDERIISAARAAATLLDQAHTAIAIADRQDAAAKQRLEFQTTAGKTESSRPPLRPCAKSTSRSTRTRPARGRCIRCCTSRRRRNRNG